MGLTSSPHDPQVRLGSVDVEVVIVGAGISGIGAGISLRRRGQESFVLLEAGTELGGTWRDNTYPGISVDIPASSFCFSFETDYPWSRAFAPGHEILDYIQRCAKKYDIERHIRYGSKVVSAHFDPEQDQWSTHLVGGETVTSRYLIAATGLFGLPRLHEFPGLETFEGQAMHSSRWDHSLDLSGKRVGIIGTGASAVQIVPELAQRVAKLTVFQRTPIWISPRPDYALSPGRWLSPRRFAPLRGVLRFFSELGLEVLTFSIVNYQRLPFLVRTVQKAVGLLMRRQLHSPELVASLVPDYGLGCKRPAPSNNYLPSFNRDNVSLVTARIERICPDGVVASDGTVYPVDTLVLATGFLTTEKGNGPAFEVFGQNGVELGQFWDDHRLQAYAGVSVPGYPNFFLTAGPYAGGFNWFTMLEVHLEHIMQCMDGARERGVTRIEVQQEAHERYMQHMWSRADGTIFKDSSCRTANSYYLDRHGDAALPLPRTPWWRIVRSFLTRTRDYRFGRDL